MWENEDRAAKIPDTARWEEWLLMLSEELREVLQLTAASVMAGLGGKMQPVSFQPVSLSGILTERIVSGGNTVLPADAGFTAMRAGEAGQVAPPYLQQETQHRRKTRTPYETVRDLQKQSEQLLRT